jgi:deoxyribodipyrimidine photo-lyase
MSRILRLIDAAPSPEARYVLYWMQASQRVEANHALFEAARIAKDARLPLFVLFVLDASYPGANARSFTFLLEGLAQTATKLKNLGIPLVFREGRPNDVLNELAEHAHTVVIDVGYTRIQRAWRKTLYLDLIALHPRVSLVSAECDVLVPVRDAMDKAAYGAYVLRPKIHKLAALYRDTPPLPTPQTLATPLLPSSRDLADWKQWFNDLPIDHLVPPSTIHRGGASEAKRRLDRFLSKRLPHYLESADPSREWTSELSMYLHFGQIGIHTILDELDKITDASLKEAKEAFFEQLVVRRELAVNFVFYNEGYDHFETMTEPWAYQSMARHEADARPYRYTKTEFEQSKTHDPIWNACMTQMRVTGSMPNYLRMYWAKKVIEWSPTHKEAYQTLLALNDTYFLDGRDPNGYAGVAWCFGRHDRPWTERPVFGTLRYMNEAGLRRKFDIDAYVRNVHAQCIPEDNPLLQACNEGKE